MGLAGSPRKQHLVKYTNLDTHMLKQALADYHENTKPSCTLKKKKKVKYIAELDYCKEAGLLCAATY